LLFDESVNVLADQIRFNIDFITNPTDAQISVLQRKWNDGHVKLSQATSVYRQADPIDSHRTFGHQQRPQTLSNPKRKECKVTLPFDGTNNPDPVYVASHKMPAQPIIEPHRTFQI
jgi:hypothetical protein